MKQAKINVWRIAANVYHALPISFSRKTKLKDFLFTRLGVFLKDTPPYREWVDFHSITSEENKNFSESIQQLINSDLKQLQDRFRLSFPDHFPLTLWSR